MPLKTKRIFNVIFIFLYWKHRLKRSTMLKHLLIASIVCRVWDAQARRHAIIKNGCRIVFIEPETRSYFPSISEQASATCDFANNIWTLKGSYKQSLLNSDATESILRRKLTQNNVTTASSIERLRPQSRQEYRGEISVPHFKGSKYLSTYIYMYSLQKYNLIVCAEI